MAPDNQPTETNGDAPATRADLANVAGEFTERINSLDTRVANLERTVVTKRDLKAFEQRVATKNDLQRILKIIESIDSRLRDAGNIAYRFDRLERDAFRR